MLPDLRIVIAAVISTAGVGFFTSSRLMSEPKKRTDTFVTVAETPVDRIALSWPEPVRQSEALELDFAVTARALRNPVRDITDEGSTAVEQQKETSVRTTVIERDGTHADAGEAPAQIEPPAAPAERLAPAPDIRIAVQYPPLQDLPVELKAPATPIAEPAQNVVAAKPATDIQPETPDNLVTTGSIAEPPASIPLQPDSEPSETKVVNRPDPADADTKPNAAVQQADAPKPAAKTAPKAAPKKAAPAKAAKRPARITRRPVVRRVTPFPAFDTTFPLTFLGHRFPN